jgi:hypothetical protein
MVGDGYRQNRTTRAGTFLNPERTPDPASSSLGQFGTRSGQAADGARKHVVGTGRG